MLRPVKGLQVAGVLWIVVGVAWQGSRAGAAVPALGAQPDSAQLKSMSLEQLGNVKVTTVSKQPEEVWHTPAAVYVLTHDDIERSGATTIPDLLRLVPGVQVSQEQSDQWAVGIRGFDSPFSKGLLVLINGRSVYTPLDEGVYWDVQDYPFEDIERIEIIRGPGGAIWGPNAVNGVINIITKSGADAQGAMVQSDGGDAVERFNGAVRYGFSPTPDLKVRVFAKGFNRGPELNPGHNPYDDWHQERGGFHVEWEHGSQDSVAVGGMIYGGESGEEIQIATFNPPANRTVDGVQKVAGGDVRLRWDRKLSGGSNFYVQAYFDRTDRNTPQFAETRNTFDVDFIDHIAGLPRQEVEWGAGLRESPSAFEAKHPTLDVAPHEQNDYLYSLFVQDQIQLLPDRLAVTLGSKFEDNNFSGWGAEPSARLLWNPRSQMTFWGSVSRALRTPGRLDTDAKEMIVVSARPPLYEAAAGSPNFKPEVLIGWEAGYRQLILPSVYVDVAAFHNQYDDLESYGTPSLSRPTTPYAYTLYTFPFANGLKGVTDGVEIAPDWKPVSWFDLRGSFSHVHMALHSKPGFSQAAYAANDEGFVPHRMASVQGIFGLPHGVEIVPDYRFVSRLPVSHAPAWQTADAHVEWKFTKNWAIAVNGRNLLQPHHAEGVGDDGNGVGIRRSVYAELRWTE
jgi:iron complex outermembrane receptor protein